MPTKQNRYVIVAASPTEAEVKIYGSIGRWNDNSARSLSSEIARLDQTNKQITFRFHSEGGEVFEGTAIFNAIRNCQSKTVGIVEGIACSMAFILLMACDEAYMYKPTYLMCHGASGGAYGNAKELKQMAALLDQVDTTLSEIIQERTGKTVEDVAKWMEKDTWFTSKEALAAGLIDGIKESDKAQQLPKPPKNRSTWKPENLFGLYPEALFTEEPIQAPDNSIQTNKPKTMKLTQEQIKAMGLKGVTAESDDAAIEAAVQAKIKADKQKITELTNKVNEERNAKITAFLDSAQEQQRLTAKQRENMDKLVNEGASYETIKALVDEMPARTKITDALIHSKGNGTGGRTGSADDRENWTWDDYQEKDPEALEAMEANNKTEFLALYNKKFRTRR